MVAGGGGGLLNMDSLTAIFAPLSAITCCADVL